MKTNHTNKRSQGFTLIEMVGVLAVIAILAAILVPKIFGAIAESRCSSTVSSINSLRTAVTDYMATSQTLPANIADVKKDAPWAPKVGTAVEAFAISADKTAISVVLDDVDPTDATRIIAILGDRATEAAGTTDGLKKLTVLLADRN